MTFCKASRLGTLIWGAVRSLNGLTLLMALTVEFMTLFADWMSLWIDVRMLLNVLERKSLIYLKLEAIPY